MYNQTLEFLCRSDYVPKEGFLFVSLGLLIILIFLIAYLLILERKVSTYRYFVSKKNIDDEAAKFFEREKKL